MTGTLNVDGMVCATCQAHVQKALDHTPEEHILISEYQRAIEALMEALSAL